MCSMDILRSLHPPLIWTLQIYDRRHTFQTGDEVDLSIYQAERIQQKFKLHYGKPTKIRDYLKPCHIGFDYSCIICLPQAPNCAILNNRGMLLSVDSLSQELPLEVCQWKNLKY